MAPSKTKRRLKSPEERTYGEIVMFTWEHREAIRRKMAEEGLTKTQVVRRALDAYFFNKRRVSDNHVCEGPLELKKRTPKAI